MITEEFLQATKDSHLPVIQRPIDNTALSAYLACPREYAFSMMLNRRSKGTSAALAFGKAWHKAMEYHYKTDGNRDMVILGVTKTYEDHDSADDYRTLNRVLLDYDKYVAKYGKPSSENGKTVGWPDAPLVELSTNAQGDGLIHPWAGKIDRVVEIGGLYYIEDHKTTSRLDKNYFKQFELSYQMMGYTYLGKQLLPGKKIAGVRINLSHVLTGKTEFHRQLFSYSEDQIREWVRVTNRWMLNLAADIRAYLDLLDEGFSSITAITQAFPAHFGDNGCSRKFGMCQYYEVCSLNERLRERKLEMDFDVNPWNPLDIEDD
jgi:hypothetical protein